MDLLNIKDDRNERLQRHPVGTWFYKKNTNEQ